MEDVNFAAFSVFEGQGWESSAAKTSFLKGEVESLVTQLLGVSSGVLI